MTYTITFGDTNITHLTNQEELSKAFGMGPNEIAVLNALGKFIIKGSDGKVVIRKVGC